MINQPFFLHSFAFSGTLHLSAFTSENVNAPADIANDMINPTKIISI